MDPEPDPDPYLVLMDPEPGGPKAYGSESATQAETHALCSFVDLYSTVPTGTFSSASTDMRVALTQREER
jgi:hypothetical protein